MMTTVPLSVLCWTRAIVAPVQAAAIRPRVAHGWIRCSSALPVLSGCFWQRNCNRQCLCDRVTTAPVGDTCDDRPGKAVLERRRTGGLGMIKEEAGNEGPGGRDAPSLTSQAMLEGLPDAVVAADAGGRIVFANALAEELFGY